MKIVDLIKEDIEEVVALWNSETKDEIYKPFNLESFTNLFIKTNNSKNLVLKKDNEIIGFGNAVFRDNDEKTPGFITAVVIKKAYQRKGYGSKLLKELEDVLRDNNKKYVRQLFLNPILLEWYIPNTNKHDHPGAPAIEYNSSFYLFLLNNGYNVTAGQQDAYYLDLNNFKLPSKVVLRNKENEAKGYYITFYDDQKHYGFKELFEALKNPTWYQAVKNNLAKENPNKMLVVVKDNLIVGWTGPLYTEASGRGYFAGIGVHPNTQGLGLGTSLFNELLYQSSKNGAKFMSLFTGSENLARNIYLKAGFKLVKSFAILRKEL